MKPSAEVNVQPHLAVCDLPAALARMGANVELVREMLDLFREDAPIYQLRLHDALAASNAPGIEHASHSLKGMLCMFGAGAAMQIADRLERIANAGELQEAPALELELNHEISRFLETVTTELARL